MLFNSFEFAIFLPIVWILYWALPHKCRWVLLLAASYYFYMSWNVKYVVLILFTTLVSYVAAILLEKAPSDAVKRRILALSCTLCLIVLFFFKYFNFATESFCALLGLFSIRLHPFTLSLLLPVGISFYTFQTLSYVIDVYRGKIRAEHHLGYYATFVSFFPQLVAGPIERTDSLLPQIRAEHTFDYDQVTYGLKQMAWGFFKKLCIADVIASYVDAVYANPGTNAGFPMLFALFAFTIQIYCDFSGYSDIAIGTANLMGIRLMTNFKSPYFSTSIREFWQRWHISLSTWFRDYVYIPLGGNRCGKIRQSLNLLITFLVSGLWHGANWTFVIWGGIHGVAQIIENRIFPDQKTRKDHKAVKVLRWALVFLFCNLAWVFFRADTFSDAVYVLTHLFTGIGAGKQYLNNSIGLDFFHMGKIGFCLLLLAAYDFASLKTDVIASIGKRPLIVRWGIYLAFAMVLFLFAQVGNHSFIYFQF